MRKRGIASKDHAQINRGESICQRKAQISSSKLTRQCEWKTLWRAKQEQSLRRYCFLVEGRMRVFLNRAVKACRNKTGCIGSWQTGWRTETCKRSWFTCCIRDTVIEYVNDTQNPTQGCCSQAPKYLTEVDAPTALLQLRWHALYSQLYRWMKDV